jgi:regulator of nucleoside diphosphate kinase
VKNNQIHVTNYDLERLKQLLEAAKNTPESNTAVLNYLGNLLESAHIYRQEEVPPYVVTMNSHVKITDLDENSDMEFRLVYPDETPLDKDKISVLTPMGAAILGLKTGDIVEYLAENKTKHLRITHISYQPEANNHYRL